MSEEAAKNLSGKELLQAAIADRAYIPIRGKKKKPTKKGAKTQITERAEHKKVIRIEESISVSELSQAMGVKAADLIRKLMQAGKMATINQQIDADTAAFLATEFGFTVEKKGFEVEEYIPEVAGGRVEARHPAAGRDRDGPRRPRQDLAPRRHPRGRRRRRRGGRHHPAHRRLLGEHRRSGPITFLDTPGHEAFTAMRQRGAQVTDLVVLVVAADDGVMPQTIESIKAAKAAGVTILVAINKIDKPNAAPERVMQQLTEYELVAEQWGGTTIMVPVSARTKQGIPELLEYIALQSEVLELKANPETLAAGRVIEAKLEKGRGPVATVLVEEGTLRVGDALVTGIHYGRVRAMMNERGEQVDDVGPGYPVEVLGLSGVPVAGDEFNVVEDEKSAKEVAAHRAEKAAPEGARQRQEGDARGPVREGEERRRQDAERRRQGRRPGLLRGGDAGAPEGRDEEGRGEDPRLRRRRRHRVRRPHRGGRQGDHRRASTRSPRRRSTRSRASRA